MNYKKNILLILAVVCMFLTGNLKSWGAEYVDLPLKSGGTVKANSFYKGKTLIATSQQSKALLLFDTSVLRFAEEYELLSVELCLFDIKMRGKEVKKIFVGIDALKEKFQSYVEKKNFNDLQNQKLRITVFEWKSPLNSAKKKNLIIPLPIKHANLKQAFENGFVVQLRSDAKKRFDILIPGVTRGTRPVLRVKFQSKSKIPKFGLHVNNPPVNGKFLHKEGSNLIYNARTIRLWGINLRHTFSSKTEIYNTVRRIRNMGYNAVRLWSTSSTFYSPDSARQKAMISTRKGDNSPLDLYDYLVARIKSEGLFIQNTDLGYLYAKEMIQYWPDLTIDVPLTMSSHDYRALPYIDDSLMKLRLQHLKNYLGRLNPYTGRKYAQDEVFAVWELSNENQIVDFIAKGHFRKWPKKIRETLQQRWNKWLLKHYGNRAAIKKAWGTLGEDESPEKGTVAPAPVYKEQKQYPQRRGNDFLRFAQDCFIQGSQRLKAAAEAMSPKGSGTNIVPFVANTHYLLSLHCQYAYSCLDINALASYQAPYTFERKNAPHFPWKPFSSYRPYFYNNNFRSIADKAMIIYENSYVRPYPYRAEWTPALTFMHAGHGLDGAFMFHYGVPSVVTDKNANDLGFLTTPLRIPRFTAAQEVSDGYAQANDEISMSSAMITGQAFINGIKENRVKTQITFGKPAIYGMQYKLYSNSQPVGNHPNGDVGGGEAEWFIMPKLYQEMMFTSIRRNLSLKFDPNQKAAIRIDGKLFKNDSEEAISPSSDITWDKPAQRIILDTSHSKIVVGHIRNGHTFKDGVSLGPLNSDFAIFGISSKDGLPIKDSKDLILVLASTSANTGFKFDNNKIKGSIIGHINGIVNIGNAPVQVKRVAATIKIPGKEGILTCYNFGLFAYRKEKIHNEIKFSALEPLFVARITRKPKGLFSFFNW
jgi:regulator of replication initiation timing